jgi:hypothetical protein|tara:strand:+ start:271 stop:1533 length:1263 start_codon:yes stop_codon:yes gene_type:complete
MKTYQKFIIEKKGDTVVFTFGRFNPPTVGHEKLITAVQSVSKTEGGDYFVYPSHSQDSKKNPLTQSQKIKYMKKMFSKHSRNIISSVNKTALEIASELYDKKYTKLVMVVGSDRVREFQSLLDRYNGETYPHGFYDFDKIKVVSAGERDPDAEGVEGMSASKMREAAVQGDFKLFRTGTPSSLSDSDTKKMLNDIRKAKRLDVVKEGSKWKNIDFSNVTLESPIELDETHQITYKGYTTKYLHTSSEAYDVMDEIVNAMFPVLPKKKEMYLKSSIIALDEFLEYRNSWLIEGQINKKDLFLMEQLSEKYSKFMDNLGNIDHIDNSFIYKYISRISETLKYDDCPSLIKKETVIHEESPKQKHSEIINFVKNKLKITHNVATKLVQKAVEKNIDLLKIQQKWSMLAPTLTKLVAEYEPKEK